MEDNNKYRMLLGKEISDLRKSHNLSVEELSEKVGITPAHLSRIEAGKYNVRIDILSSIGNVLGKSIHFS